MEVTCSFKKLVGGICASDKRYEREDVVPLSSCNKDVTGHTRSVGITDVHSEVELVLARASIFAPPHDISTWTICPAHRSSLGIGWRRGANRCRVPPGLSEHTAKGRTRKADRGIAKSESRAILRQTGVFVPVGSGKYTLLFVPACSGVTDWCTIYLFNSVWTTATVLNKTTQTSLVF